MPIDVVVDLGALDASGAARADVDGGEVACRDEPIDGGSGDAKLARRLPDAQECGDSLVSWLHDAESSHKEQRETSRDRGQLPNRYQSSAPNAVTGRRVRHPEMSWDKVM